MAPDRLSLIALAQSRLAPRLDGAFRYADLGCGSGASLVAHAALYPQAEFHGFDYLPEHVVLARHLAEEAGQVQSWFHEADFAALAEADPPGGRFDFIVCHGVWSWVSAEHRAHLVRIAGRWLKPGGLFYLSYNARPYWNALDPLRRVVRELLGDPPEAADFKALRETVSAWLERSGSERMRSYWARVSQSSDRYLVHDFGARHAEAFWPMDVEDSLTAARLEFMGPVELAGNFETLSLEEPARQALAQDRAAGFPRAAADMAAERPFRADVFARGAPVLPLGRLIDAYAAWELRPAAPGPEDMREDAGSGRLSEASAARIEGLKARMPLPLGQAIAALDLPERKALQLVLLAAATRVIELRPPLSEAARQGLGRFNAVARRQSAQGAVAPAVICARSGRIHLISRADAGALWEGQAMTPEQARWLPGLDIACT